MGYLLTSTTINKPLYQKQSDLGSATWQKVTRGSAEDGQKQVIKTRNTVILVVILAVLVFGGLVVMLVIFSAGGGTPDNAIEIFSLDFTPTGTPHFGSVGVYSVFRRTTCQLLSS